MTLAEFKAWFSGFTEDMDGPPSEKQWKRIKARVKEIDGVAVTKTVFVDHYVPPIRPYWYDLQKVYCSAAAGIGAVSYNSQATDQMRATLSGRESPSPLKAIGAAPQGLTPHVPLDERYNQSVARLNEEQFDSSSAMLNLGKAEYTAALNS